MTFVCVHTLDTESHKRAELRITDISNFVSEDWINLARELGFQSTDIAQIQKEYPDSIGQQCMSMLNLWMNEISGQDSGTILCSHTIRLGIFQHLQKNKIK